MNAITRVYTHENPHLDEGVAIWLLNKFGESLFPGIAAVSEPYKICYLNGGGKYSKTAEAYETMGALLIGTGGGRFDEHPSENGERKENKCAATLVAEALGIANDLALEQILKSTSNNDLKGAGEPMGMAKIMKSMLENNVHPGRVLLWLFMGLDAMYETQRKFHYETAKEFSEVAEVKEISSPKGTIRVAIIKSDNAQMSIYARSEVGGNAAIVIQSRSTGHIAVTNKQALGIRMNGVVRAIRIAERRKNGIESKLDRTILESEGRIEGAENWWYQEGTGAILNSSPTAQGIEPTKLSLDEVFNIVKNALNPQKHADKKFRRK